MLRKQGITPLRSKRNRCILLGMTEAAAVEFKYRGRKISPEDILYIRALVERHPNESRRTLSTMLCEAWQWCQANGALRDMRSEEHTSELQSLRHLVCRLLLEKNNSKPLT